MLELKKRFRKDLTTFTHLSGCYVNSEKHIVSKFSEFFLGLEEDELLKYLEIAKKVLSGTIGNNILKLDFQLDEDFTNQRQTSLIQLKNSGLKDNQLLDEFYELIIEHYDYPDNFLILIFHDAYDVMTKTKDNKMLDDSEEVYDYLLCAICPVSLSKSGLSYLEDEDKIKARIRDWVVDMPTNGFVFPAFVDRSSDVNAVTYYARRPKEPHPELMEKVLGCHRKQTTTIQKETFQSLVKDSLGLEEEQADTVFMDVQDQLKTMVDEYKSLYEGTDLEPITLTTDHVQELLVESGVPEEITGQIEDSYQESFGDDLPLAEGLIDQKVLKASAQTAKERTLKKQIKVLSRKLEEANKEPDGDILVQVTPEKASEIKSEIIHGQKCMIIPIAEDEKVVINGLDLQ